MSTEYKQPNVKAATTKRTFSRETIVRCSIDASAETIWQLLTNADDYPSWSTTVTSIEGTIAPNETIKLKSTIDSKRTFTLKVKEFEPHRKLVWGDAMGNRVYLLEEQEDGSTVFTMTEKIGGPIFPLFARMIPSFDESFDAFARDLKKQAERK